MKITRVTAYALGYPEPNDRNNRRYLALAQIETEAGLDGWGEGIAMWPEAALAVKTLIERGLGAVLIGGNPLENHALYLALKKHLWWYGGAGLANLALSALDMALWDLKGKALGVPVHTLLGGKLHDRLRVCASTHPSKSSLHDLAEELAAHVRNGYTAVKVGFGKTGEANLGVDPQRDLEFVRVVREAIGPETDFIVDLGVKNHWTYSTGLKMAREFERYNLRWIEDPFSTEDLAAYQRLRQSIHTPLATGEREWTPAGYKRLIEAGCADIYVVDPGRVEGITGYKKVMDLTADAQVFFNAHSWSSAVNTAAALHATATGQNYIVLELKPLPSPMQHELVREPFAQRNGWIEVPDKPGLGIEIVHETLEEYNLE